MLELKSLGSLSAEVRQLLTAGDYAQAVAIYEDVLDSSPHAIKVGLNFLSNLSLHKAVLKCRIASQLLAQKDISKGFYVNFGNYCFLDTPAPDVFVGVKTIEALERYKGSSPSIRALTKGVFSNAATHPQITTLIYCAHFVAGDVIDLSLLWRNYLITSVVDIGAGAGLQAVMLARLDQKITSVHLFEVQDYMQASITELFKENSVEPFHLNRTLEQPVDCFYSFRACGYLFSVETYLEEFRKGRSRDACALLDIGHTTDPANERSAMRKLFGAETLMYRFGPEHDHPERILFDEPFL